MNHKQRNLIIGIVVLIVIVGIAYWVLIGSRICCAFPPEAATQTAIVSKNDTLQMLLTDTATAAFFEGQTLTTVFRTAIAGIITATPSSFPYDPTLYAQRRHEEQILQTAAGPDDYATFYAEETALVATYQKTIIPTPLPYDPTLYAQRRRDEELIRTNTGPIYTAEYFYMTETALVATYQKTIIPTTPLPYEPTLYAQRRHEEQILQTGAGPTQYAIFFATETALVATYQGTVLPTFTPIPYTADMSPTIMPRFNTRTATPTLCPPSDVVCPGGNATMSAADKVMVLMASASAPEFGQLAQTATALAITPTPTPTSGIHDSNCAFSWAHQDLPEIATAAREAFSTISMAKIDVLRADAYGENCNRADGSLSYFAAMTTDFYLSVEVTDLSDFNQLAQIVRTAYTVLSELKVKLPAQAGYLDIVFSAGEQQTHFRAMFGQIKASIDAGSSAPALLAVGKM
jgi:hypothetical protein